MGGFGSGQRWGFVKSTVESCLALNIEQLVKQRLVYAGMHAVGSLKWTRSYSGETVSWVSYEINSLDRLNSWIRLNYTNNHTHEYVDYTIRLTFTKPNFGGIRWWFICPLVRNGKLCNRRAGRLYLTGGAKYFGCRICYGLTYTSCQESHRYDGAFAELATSFPGMTGKRIKRLLEEKWKKERKRVA
jgi:hypothetical protein